jgi:hypothetical protein
MNTLRFTWGIVIVIAVIVLAMIGERVSPTNSSPTAGKSDRSCKVDAPEPLRAAANRWCSNGLVARVAVTADDKAVVTVVNFSPNGAQTFQLQGAGILSTFRTLTEELAAASPGRDVSVAVHDFADHRLAACARRTADASATCSVD